MELLTEDMKNCIRMAQLCYVATVNEDGTPNLSPKGSLAVFDDSHLVFANMASPDTVANLRKRPSIELNVVDIFKRRGYRFKGTAELMLEGTYEYAFVAKPLWSEHGKNFPVHEVIKVRLERIREIRSPAYTYGENVTEQNLVETFLKIYTKRIEGNH